MDVANGTRNHGALILITTPARPPPESGTHFCPLAHQAVSLTIN
ncbi:hypothetical protein [Kistimonas scapharcae]